MLATILVSILLWLIGAIYAAILVSPGSIAVIKGIILGLTLNSITSHSVDNKFSISLVRGVLGCNQRTRLVVVKNSILNYFYNVLLTSLLGTFVFALGGGVCV